MKKLIFYPGRFQPFGPHHLAVYETLCETFKGDTVYILTSNKVDSDKSPFSFKEKRDIMESMGVPRERIVQVVNPYKPTELTSKLKPNTFGAIFAFSSKDSGRFSFTKADGSESYFQPYDGEVKNFIEDKAYVYEFPEYHIDIDGIKDISGSSIRNFIRKGLEVSKIYPSMDKKVQSMIKSKLQEDTGIDIRNGSLDTRFKLDPEFYEKLKRVLKKLPSETREELYSELKEAKGSPSEFHEDKTISYYHNRIDQIVPEDVHVKLSIDQNTIFIKFPDEYRPKNIKKGSEKQSDREDEKEKNAPKKKHEYITGLSFRTPKDAKISLAKVKGSSIPLSDKLKSLTPSMNRLPSTIKRTKDPKKRQNLAHSLRLLRKFYEDLKGTSTEEE
jgi:hypothetical protein